MSKFYAVKLSVIAIVQVRDNEGPGEAEDIADDLKRGIIRDCPELDITTLEQIHSVKDLDRHGWDGRCIPYGIGDGNTTLAELLPE